MPYMTEFSESEKEKKKKEKKTLVAELTPLLLLSLFSCCHLTSPVISLYYSSFLTLPCLFILSPCSHVLSHTTILYLFIYFFILCGNCGLLVYEPPDILCEFTVVFWNLKQLFEILNFNYTCFHFVNKNNVFIFIIIISFLIVIIQVLFLYHHVYYYY